MKIQVIVALIAAMPFVAQASDLPSKKSTQVPSSMSHAVDTWTGAYVGITGGYGWGSSEFDDGAFTFPAPANYNYDLKSDGWIVGGVAGYDWQLSNNLVIGIVGDVSWADVSGKVCVDNSGSCSGDSRDSYADVKIDLFATARARVGYALDNTLLYVTGGAAYASATSTITNVGGEIGYNSISADENIFGWVIGGGAEYKLNRNMSVGIEYLHVDFGGNTVHYSNADIAPVSIGVETTTTVDLVRGSLNYRF